MLLPLDHTCEAVKMATVSTVQLPQQQTVLQKRE